MRLNALKLKQITDFTDFKIHVYSHTEDDQFHGMYHSFEIIK